MQFRTLGRTGLKVSRIGLGTGGVSRLGQTKGYSERESHRVVHRALDLGINVFDTSPAYSESEAILGRALHSASASSSVYISTKVYLYRAGPYDDPKGTTLIDEPEEIVRSVERSLQRLNRDVLDIVLLHGVRPASYRRVIERAYPVLLNLQEQGKIRWLGISETFAIDGRQATLSRAIQTDLFDAIMLAYAIFAQGAARRILPTASDKGIGIMGMSPVRPPFCRPMELRQWIKTLKRDGKLGPRALSSDDPVSAWIEAGPGALATGGIKFASAQSGLDTVFTGTANIAHLEANVRAALDEPLPSSVIETLREIYGQLDEPRP